MAKKKINNDQQLDLFSEYGNSSINSTRDYGGASLARTPPEHDSGTGSRESTQGSTLRSTGDDDQRTGATLPTIPQTRTDRTTSGQSGVGGGQRELHSSSSGKSSAELVALDVLDFSSNAKNYYITESDQLESASLSQKFNDNIAAIERLRQLQETRLKPSASDQSTLVKYSGWGGLPQAFGYDDDPKWNRKRELVSSLLTKDEYAAARASTLNSHYTSPTVIEGLYQAIEHMGFNGGQILEPACGTGHFLGVMPRDMHQRSHITGIEIDSISANITKALYPESTIHHSPFEKVKLKDSAFDLAISNVPFGNYSVHDPRFNDHKFPIHDYFFAASLEHVRPGGIVAFITSHHTLDKTNSKTREHLTENAEFLGAIRLPNNSFEKIANTKVTTDIVFLQKIEKNQVAQNRDWIDLAPIQSSTGDEIFINRYFAENPDMMLGQMTLLKRGLYGDQEPALVTDGSDLKKALSSAISKLPQNIYQRLNPFQLDQQTQALEKIPDNLKENAFHILKNGTITILSQGELIHVEGIPNKTANRIRGLVNVREATRECLQSQLEGDDETILQARQNLNQEYDRFVRSDGAINLPVNARCFRHDPDSALLRSLENYNESTKTAQKASIFHERTIRLPKSVTSTETPQEALLVSLNERGTIDLPFMESLLDQPPDEFLPKLKGAIYTNPETKAWETEDEYLSGNVRRKLEVAKLASEKDSFYKDNVSALENVQPVDLTASEIDARLGSTWIPTEDASLFISALLKVPRDQASVYYAPLIGTWNIEASFTARRGLSATSEWGTERYHAIRLIDDALNLRIPTVRDTDSEGNTRVNIKETEAARAKQSAIKERFVEWIWEDDERRERLTRKYNTELNNTRLRTFNGDHLTLPGITANITLRSHQKAAVWRTLQNENTLLAHVVGAGKTFTMVASAMEMKRLGIAQKPMIVVPNHMLGQFSAELLQLYPNANILVAGKEDFQKSKRAELFARISTGNWDSVIVTHSGFEHIPMSKEATEKHIKNQISEMETAIIEQRSEASGNRLVKDLEKMKRRLETKLETLSAEGKKDNTLTFEELGVDRLFIDEAHYYKNLQFTTKMTRVAGLPNTSSQRAFDLFLKTRFIQDKENGGVVFATATPIANSVAEMYTMQRYLQPKALSEKGIAHFDAWAGTFGETVTAMELSPDGSGYRVNTRFARFINVPELMGIFREVADVQTAEMLNLPVPKLTNDRAEVISAPQSDQLQTIVTGLAKRAHALKNGNVNPRDDNMLKITTEGRKAALDLRVLDPDYPDIPENKVNLVTDNIHQIWQDTQEKRLTQMVFCDLSRPNPKDGQFSVYEEIREKLINKGIPPQEIEFIHNHEKDAAKLTLFKKLRAGEIRILLGSTQKMGTGTNAQRLLYALHHLDAPWRPADIEQREGRILRQGNLNPEVRIMRYVSEGSFDGYMWQTLETKARFISQVMSGDTSIRSIEDLDSPALSYAEVKAIASGNPLVLEKAQVDAEVMRLSILKSQHKDSQFRIRSKIRAIESRIPQLEEQAAKMLTDSSNKIVTKGELFRIQLGNNTYTERKAAGEYILNEVNNNFTKGKSIEIGTFGHLTIQTIPHNANEIRIKGNLSYKTNISVSPLGIISSLENIYPSIDKRLLELQEDLHQDHDRLKGLVQVRGQKFEHDKKLNGLLTKQKELLNTLSIDQAPQIVESENIPSETIVIDTTENCKKSVKVG